MTKNATTVRAQVKKHQISSQHHGFQKFSTQEGRFKKRQIKYIVDTETDFQGLKKLVFQPEYILESRISICPEFAAYLFFLDGCPKNLLIYLIMFEIDVKTGSFEFNSLIIERFFDFCKHFGHTYKPGVVKQALRKLTQLNIIENERYGRYLINPLLIGSTSEDQRRQLLQKYHQLLQAKGKDLKFNFYPKYEKV